MSVFAWIVIAIVGMIAAWAVLKTILTFAIPLKISGSLLLKQELRQWGVKSDNLPSEFFEEAVDWARNVSMSVGPSSPLAKRAEFVRAIETLARTAALWLSDPGSTMFKSYGNGKNGYRALFEKYDLRGL